VSADLRELYRHAILDHGRQPRNFRVLGSSARRAERYNPLCGDQVTVYVEVVDGVLNDVSFQGAGCLIAMASASMMTEAVKGKTRSETDALFREFRALLRGDDPPVTGGSAALRNLAACSGIRKFPARVACATLPWHALQAALDGVRDVRSTE
jgi:nitrogen fixation NifU-like protein